MKAAIYFSVFCMTASSALAYHDFGSDVGYDADRPLSALETLEALSRDYSYGDDDYEQDLDWDRDYMEKDHKFKGKDYKYKDKDYISRRYRNRRLSRPYSDDRDGVSKKPTKFGIVVYPGFQALDVFGPLDILNTLSESVKMDLTIISKTWQPVSTKGPEMKNIWNAGSSFSQQIWPTATFATTSKDLDVLIVPGGIGAFKIDQAYIDFIKGAYPKLKYLITVGTGSGIVAMTGVLDGKKATSSKAIWNWSVQQGKKVHWQRKARWTVDGKIWSSSGKAAGMDMTFAFVNEVFGGKNSTNVANLLEYPRNRRADFDPYSNVWRTTRSNNTMTRKDKMRNNFL
ncbi:class I glutamine amidotransferase-like protein [Morchella snyderi]|nr:class I glutamine amidotransferase-like protein [Morchella snyderi]